MVKTKKKINNANHSKINATSKKTFKRDKSYNSVRNKKCKKNVSGNSVFPKNLTKEKLKNGQNQNLISKTKLKHRSQNLSLRERMLEKLKAAKFRFLNEQLYTSDGNDMQLLFKKDLKTYVDYHEGFRQQVAQWPINPVDIIIKTLMKKLKSSKLTIADFGCGEAKISASLEGLAKVYSFDLIALNNRVTQCDMSHTQLQSSSVDIAVFCLSLMGTNLSGYIMEANRVLKDGGLLKIAEVESRFQNVDDFVRTIERFGFKSTSYDSSHQLFYFFNFKKISNVNKKRKNKLPELNLKPCLYKKR
ncbi:ribosomal RNA-processing protein 8 isoform X1 [Lycorma delicatula]|uniref:ribosomal RNA-processing protein 8 isoform X1 n=1 Tax=Lycorma delicatula TaxID=130591 RepID=UPI003F517315